MSRRTQLSVAAAIIILILVLGMFIPLAEVEHFLQRLADRPVLAAVLYVCVLAISIVALPITSLPLLPLAAHLFGVWIGGGLSVLGWWIGSIIAFLLARHVGRPILQRVVSLQALDAWEKNLPKDITFFSIILLRLVTPVDVVSFPLGLSKSLSFRTYAWATLIGITPFAFVWVWLGRSLLLGEWLLTVSIGIVMIIAVMLLRRAVASTARRRSSPP